LGRPEADWGPSALLLSIPNGPRLCGCNGRGYSAGEWITASGEWINDRTHGQQFKARFLRTSPPTSAHGIEKYLCSGMIRGVGPVYAKKLVRADHPAIAASEALPPLAGCLARRSAPAAHIFRAAHTAPLHSSSASSRRRASQVPRIAFQPMLGQ